MARYCDICARKLGAFEKCFPIGEIGVSSACSECVGQFEALRDNPSSRSALNYFHRELIEDEDATEESRQIMKRMTDLLGLKASLPVVERLARPKDSSDASDDEAEEQREPVVQELQADERAVQRYESMLRAGLINDEELEILSGTRCGDDFSLRGDEGAMERYESMHRAGVINEHDFAVLARVTSLTCVLCGKEFPPSDMRKIYEDDEPAVCKQCGDNYETLRSSLVPNRVKEPRFKEALAYIAKIYYSENVTLQAKGVIKDLLKPSEQAEQDWYRRSYIFKVLEDQSAFSELQSELRLERKRNQEQEAAANIAKNELVQQGAQRVVKNVSEKGAKGKTSSNSGCIITICILILIPLLCLIVSCLGGSNEGSSENLSSVSSTVSSSRSSSSSGRASTSGSSGSSDLKFSVYNQDDGNSWYVYEDGSREYTDGFGNVVRDDDGDGEIDSYSTDGGGSWTDY